MDQQTKKRVIPLQRKTPRFLFRGWCNSELHASGGHVNLNSKEAIIPRAFQFGHISAEQTIFDLRRGDLQKQVLNHLRAQVFPAQLSSRASSMKVAMYFGKRAYWNICSSCYVSIVDTKMLRDKNVFLYVPCLDWLDRSCMEYKHEYLCHGIVSGDALKAVPLHMVVNAGIPELSYSGISPVVKSSPRRHSTSYRAITAQELQAALDVGKMYGGEFVVPVTVAILCQTTRDNDLWRSGNIPELDMVAEALKDYHIPLSWCSEEDILTSIVDTGGYGDVDQMISLLRVMLHHRRGRGARGRNKMLGTALSDVGSMSLMMD